MPPAVKRPSERFEDLPPAPFARPSDQYDQPLDDLTQAQEASPLPTTADYGAFLGSLVAPHFLPPPLNAPAPGNVARAATAGLFGGLGHLAGDVSNDLSSEQPLTWDRVKSQFASAAKTGMTIGGLEYAMPYAGSAAGNVGTHFIETKLAPALGSLAGRVGKALSPTSTRQGMPEAITKAEETIQKGYDILGGPSKDRPGLLMSQLTLDPEEGSAARFIEGFASGAIKGERIEPALKGQQEALRAVVGQEKSRVAGKLEQIAPANGAPGVEAQAFDRLRAAVGTQPIIDVSPVMLLLQDPQNALGRRVLSQLKIKFTQDPQTYKDLINLIDSPPQGPSMAYRLSLDQAQRLKSTLSKLGYEMRGTDADLAAGAKDLSHVVDNRIFAGLRTSAPAGQDWARQYKVAKQVTEAKTRFEELGRILNDATDPSTKSITAESLNAQLKRFKADPALPSKHAESLADAVGPTNAKHLLDLQKALEIGERDPSGIGRIVIAMKTGRAASRLAEGAGMLLVGSGGFGSPLSTMLGGAALIATPTYLGRLMTNPRLLEMLKTGQYVKPTGVPGGSYSRAAVREGARGLRQLAALLGVDYAEQPPVESPLPPTLMVPGAPPRMESQQGPPPLPNPLPEDLAPRDEHEAAYLRGRGGELPRDLLKEHLTQYRALRRSDRLQALPQ